jgi:hypothetical protein
VRSLMGVMVDVLTRKRAYLGFRAHQTALTHGLYICVGLITSVNSADAAINKRWRTCSASNKCEVTYYIIITCPRVSVLSSAPRSRIPSLLAGWNRIYFATLRYICPLLHVLLHWLLGFRQGTSAPLAQINTIFLGPCCVLVFIRPSGGPLNSRHVA